MGGETGASRGLPRWFDLISSVAGLAAASPVMLLAALAVKVTSPGPVFFRQTRVGRGGRPFNLLKFRTMAAGGGGVEITAAGDRRVTSVGRILRKTKIDELPQLLNVIRGDMALVGPRPEVPRYVDLGSPLWKEALAARPGVTDPVTLLLRNEEDLLASVQDPQAFYLEALAPFKLEGYCDYLRRRTWLSDVGVLLGTLRSVAIPPSAPPPDVKAVARGWKNRETPGSP